MKKVMKQSTMTRLLNLSSIALMVIAAVLFILSAYKNRQIDQENDNRYYLVENANRFMNGSKRLTSEVRQFAATGNEAYFNNYKSELNEDKNRDIGIENMKKIGLTAEEQQMITEMQKLSNDLVPLEEGAMEEVKAGRTQKALDYVFGQEYGTTLEKIGKLQSDFIAELDVRSTAAVEKLKIQGNIMQTVAIIFIVCIAAIQIFSLLVINKKLLRPLGIIEKEMEEIAKGNISGPMELEADTSEIGMLVYSISQTKKTLHSYVQDISDKLGMMAEGDMTVRVDLDYIGDFLPIKNAIIRISSSLRDTLMQIQQAAEQVFTGASQVSDGAQSLAQGSTEQASTMEELSASFMAVSEQVSMNADFSRQAEEMAVGAAQAIEGSNQKMQQLQSAMEEVSRHSAKISLIIKSIEDIAFQTNILALNAAVEAARAGEAGKGFAVVADEVRNLAGKSAEAAADTTQMIENTVTAVNNGMTITQEAVDGLLELVENANKTMELVQEVSKGSQKQAASVSEVEQGMEQITSVVQTNSATSEESAATSEELSSQANMMQQLVAKFRVQ